MAVQDTMQCQSVMSIPDPHSAIEWPRCNPLPIRWNRNSVNVILQNGDWVISKASRMREGEHTVWPKGRELSTIPEIGGLAIPRGLSEEISQCITRLSHDALSRPLPSGVNARLATRSVCPRHLATNFPVRTFHISTSPGLHPDAMYRPSRLHRTDQGYNSKVFRTLEDPSRSLHILTVLSNEQVTMHWPFGKKFRELMISRCQNVFLTLFWEIIHIWGKKISEAWRFLCASELENEPVLCHLFSRGKIFAIRTES